ncbi:MAG: hypothetical protein IPM96_20480 [Ignavibacteria bacterium]|nr:hypothetical protein [Ignavibacteria bacterium]
MKNLIFVISICVFVSFSLAFSNYYTSESYYAATDLLTKNFSSEEKILNFSSPPDSAEPDDSTENDVVNGVTDIANMLNERGFYKSNGFSYDEQEIINDFNGNLIFNIPLYNYPLAGNLNFNVLMKYNGSVGHQFFPGDLDIYSGNPQRYNMNIPEWIVDFNGIAVQVLNFETNFFTTENGTNNIISDDNVRLLIPGYHFSNSLEAASVEKLDKINILAGDGSVISLVRVATTETNVDSLYVGNYVYEGKEMYYKAKVTYLETTGSAGDKSRKVELMKGDGTVMIFKEYKRNYSDFPANAVVNVRTKPRVLLLETIRDRFGHEINLSYSFGLQQFGRPLLSKIETLGYSQKDVFVIMEYSIIEGLFSNMSGVHFLHSSEVNGNYHMIYESPVAHFPVGQNDVTNHRAKIKSIKIY